MNDIYSLMRKHWLRITLLLVALMVAMFTFNLVSVHSHRGFFLLIGLIFVFIGIIIDISDILPKDEQKTNFQCVLYSHFWAVPYSIFTYDIIVFDENGIWNQMDSIFLISSFILIYIGCVLLSVLIARPELGMER